jgi:hypothetical protein
VLDAVRANAPPAMQHKGPILAWIERETGLVNKGTHSIGVITGTVAKWEGSRTVCGGEFVRKSMLLLPIACRLYLPGVWAGAKQRRRQVCRRK